MKNKTSYYCTNCGYKTSKWMGQCVNCNEWNTIVEEDIVLAEKKLDTYKEAKVLTLDKAAKLDMQRVSSGFDEFDRVLGEGGFVKGSVTLLSGDPGVGKSTLLLQVCANLSQNQNVMYISAEESSSQIAIRASRIIDKKSLDKVTVVNSASVEAIIQTMSEYKPEFIVIDSIQTIGTSETRGLPGGVSQIRAVATKLIEFSKDSNSIMIIIGHINKEGTIAGPKVLEHLVDTVLQIENNDDGSVKILRGLKNRFGPTNEVGLFSMGEDGMKDMLSPQDILLTEGDAPGICTGTVLEGNRVLLVEVQALVVKTEFSLPKRVSEGVAISRLQLICAIIQKYTKINLYNYDVYLSIAGGLKVSDRELDLAIALAIISSYKNKALDKSVVAIGEMSLSGKITSNRFFSKRKSEAQRLGYKKVISAEKYLLTKDLVSKIS